MDQRPARDRVFDRRLRLKHTLGMAPVPCGKCGKPVLDAWSACKWCGEPRPALSSAQRAPPAPAPPAQRGWEGRLFAASALAVGVGWVAYVWKYPSGFDLHLVKLFFAGPCVFGPLLIFWGITLIGRRKLGFGSAALASAGILVPVVIALSALAMLIGIIYMVLSGRWHLMP